MGGRVGDVEPYAIIQFQNFDNNSGAFDYIGAEIRSHNDGDVDSGDLRFFTNDGTGGGTSERMRIDRNGNVGIGTTTPSTPLAIMGNGGTSPVGSTQNAVGGARTMELTTEDAGGDQATRILLRGAVDTADVEFYTGASGAETPTLYIPGSTGNVGIGTTSPSGRLHVASDLDPTIQFASSGDTTETRFVSINFLHSNGPGAEIVARRRANADDGMDLIFSTQPVGGSVTQRMCIKRAGNVGIGTSSSQSKLAVAGDILFGGSGASFYAPADTGRTVIVRGKIFSNGPADPSQSTAGVHSSPLGVGHYRVTFPSKAFSEVPIVTVTVCHSSNTRVGMLESVGTDDFTVFIRNGAGTRRDENFNFIAIGER